MKLIDANDNPPVFDKESYTADIPENYTPGNVDLFLLSEDRVEIHLRVAQDNVPIITKN